MINSPEVTRIVTLLIEPLLSPAPKPNAQALKMMSNVLLAGSANDCCSQDEALTIRVLKANVSVNEKVSILATWRQDVYKKAMESDSSGRMEFSGGMPACTISIAPLSRILLSHWRPKTDRQSSSARNQRVNSFCF